MWNKLMVMMMFALVLFVTPWPVDGDGLPAGGARLYYLFSSDQVEERLRAVSLPQRFREDATDLELVVIVRGADVRFADGVIQLKASTAAQSELPEYIRTRLLVDGDFFAIVDGAGRMLTAGVGRRMDQAFAIPTDVEVKTWAKIKDLFD
jgi:hypothetical protein